MNRCYFCAIACQIWLLGFVLCRTGSDAIFCLFMAFVFAVGVFLYEP